MFLQNEFKTNVNGLPELVLYSAAVEPGIIELYDGALQTTWRYEPRPLDHESPEDREHIDEQIAKSLNLGSSWSVEVNMIRGDVTEYIERQQDAPLVGQLIDEERKLQFLTPGYYFRSRYYLTLTFLPPSLKEQRLEGWLTGEAGEENKARARNLKTFCEKIYSFESGFRSQLSLERLGARGGFDDNLTFLRECVFGEHQPLALPKIPLYLSQRFAGSLSGGNEPVLEGKHVRIVCVDAFPEGSFPGVFTALERLPFPYRYHQRQILFHPDVSKKKHKDNEKAWKRAGRSYTSKLMSQNGAVDPDAAQMQLDAQEAQGIASRGEFHFGAFNSKVVLMHEDMATLRERIKLVRECFHLQGYATRLETDNMMDAWRGSWPGHSYSDCRIFPVHTKNFAHTMPKSVPFTGLKESNNPLLPAGIPPLFRAITDGQTPYDGHLHYKEAAHTLCVGPTRNGKSTGLAFVAAQWMTRFPDPQVFAFDKRGSLRILCEAMGGTYYPLQDPQLCPLGNLEDAEDQAWATSYIGYLCELNNLKVTPKHRHVISQGIRVLSGYPAEHRSLTNFGAALVSGEGNEEIRSALEYYTVDSTSGGSILDANEDNLRLDETRFAVFEMEHLLEKDKRILHAVLTYLFRLITKRLHSAKQTLIPIDEAWMTKDPRFSDVLRSWLTETASRGGAVFLSTQNLSDFLDKDNPLRDVVMNQCKNQLFLPNPSAATEEQAPQYASFGLNPAQILAIAKGQDKREYFLKTPAGFARLDFQLGKVALSFCGASSDVHHERWARLYERDPLGAPAAWLRQRNEPEWADLYEKLFEKEQEILYAVA
jgi:type IV secretion/conjugal transfer VirB4 family ATPase